ncbi:MAG: hypothetical protein ACOYOO_13940, partial [Saprospiraceae bacterium]
HPKNISPPQAAKTFLHNPYQNKFGAKRQIMAYEAASLKDMSAPQIANYLKTIPTSTLRPGKI